MNGTGRVYACVESDEADAPVLLALLDQRGKDGCAEIEFVCSVSPYRSASHWSPAEGGEVEDIDVFVITGPKGQGREELKGKLAEDLCEHFREKIDEEAPMSAAEDYEDAKAAAADDEYDRRRDAELERDRE